MKISYILFFLACSGFGFEANSQASLFSYENYISNEGDTLNYRRLISDYDPDSEYPLVIFLHGSGERGDDNEAQLKWGVMNFASDEILKAHRPVVIAPQMGAEQAWDNFIGDDLKQQAQPTLPMKLLRELIAETVKELPIDTNRIYMTGLSMGGFGTYDAIMRYPDLFAAAVPVCGGGDVSKASDIAHIPIWIFHGALDNVVSPNRSLEMTEALTEAGAHPGLTLYPKTGHFAWVSAYDDAMMMDWLFSQRRK